jgi:DNA-binding NtrC family response regulator
MSEKYPALGVLLVDDNKDWLDSMSFLLERKAGITNMLLCEDSRQVMDILSKHEIGLVLLDLAMPHISGQELLKMIKEQHPDVVVIVLTSFDQIEIAVNCIKLGAYDYFTKATEEDRLVNAVLNVIKIIELQMENRKMRKRLLADTLEHPEAFAKIITSNKTMRSIFQYIESVAVSAQPILITGESGVGKELAAQAIHELSKCSGQMVCVNVAGLDDNVFTDTLFGHVKGAFTGADTARNGMVEEAVQGTLFLDEIGDLSMSSQVKLLRILQDGEYFPLGSDKPKRMKARVVIATNHDLTAKMTSGQFRKDLFFRLKTHRVHMPPLRERKEDIPLLLDYFLEEAARELKKKKPTVPKELVHLLETYNFPGNIRELKSMIDDAITQHKSGILSMEPFLSAMGRDRLAGEEPNSSALQKNPFVNMDALPPITDSVELLVDEAMRRAKGNQSIAARMLGISQPALSKRLKQRSSES